MACAIGKTPDTVYKNSIRSFHERFPAAARTRHRRQPGQSLCADPQRSLRRRLAPGGAAQPGHRSASGAGKKCHYPQPVAGCRLRPLDQSVPRLRARLHLLLRPAQPCLLGPVAGTGFRDPADRQEQPGRAPGRTAEQARLRAGADRPGGEHRCLPAHRARAAPDPPGAGDPAALSPSGAPDHQERADPARPRSAGRTGGAEPGQRGHQPDHAGRRTETHHGAACRRAFRTAALPARAERRRGRSWRSGDWMVADQRLPRRSSMPSWRLRHGHCCQAWWVCSSSRQVRQRCRSALVMRAGSSRPSTVSKIAWSSELA